jgi:hypothetical protein
VTPAERLTIYAAENAAIIYVLIALLVVMIGVSAFFGTWWAVMRFIRLPAYKRRQDLLEKEVIDRGKEVRRLTDLCGDVEFLKSEMRRYDGIRDRTERRMREQNDEMQSLRDQLEFYKIISEHIELPDEPNPETPR